MLNLNFTPFPQLITDRLILRQLVKEDANRISWLRSNESVNKFLDRPASFSIEEAKSFIEKIETGIANNQWVYWVITKKDSNDLIGTICFWNISCENSKAEIGYELHPDFQKNGIMQEAMTVVIKYGFDTLKLETITALPELNNIPSIRILLKNNFLYDENHQFASRQEAAGLAIYYLLPHKK